MHQIINRFKQRNNMQPRRQSIGRVEHQSGFAFEQIYHKQIGDISRHAHDNRAQSLFAKAVDVLANNSVGIDRGFCLRAQVKIWQRKRSV